MNSQNSQSLQFTLALLPGLPPGTSLCRFLDLPLELRENIYHFIPSHRLSRLARSCLQVYVEVQRFLYSNRPLIIEPIIFRLSPIPFPMFDGYGTVVDCLGRIPVMALRQIQKAVFVITWPSYYERNRWNLQFVEYFLRYRIVSEDLTLVFDLPGHVYYRPRLPNLWPLLHRLITVTRGPHVRMRLILRCGQDSWGWGLRNMLERQQICESLAEVVARGSCLRRLEVWLPHPPRCNAISQGKVPVTDIYSAVSTWNNRFSSFCGWWEPYWMLCLTRIKGLESIQVMLYRAHISMYGQRQSPVPLYLNENLLSQSLDNFPQDPRLNFYFDPNGRLVMN